MKKTNKIKNIAIVMSILFSASLTQNALAEDVVVQEVLQEQEVVANEGSPIVQKVENQQLRDILKSQKDALELLNSSEINLDATLGNLTTLGALKLFQETQNSVESTVVKDNQQGMFDEDGNPYEQIRENNRQSDRAPVSQENNTGNAQSTKKDKAVEEEVDIKATAVYTLGNVGYAEINYNGTKAVVKQGGKLPNGMVVESLTPLSVVISDGKDKKVIPIVAEASQKEDFSLTAPKAN